MHPLLVLTFTSALNTCPVYASRVSRTRNIIALNIKFIFTEGGFPPPAGLFVNSKCLFV